MRWNRNRGSERKEWPEHEVQDKAEDKERWKTSDGRMVNGITWSVFETKCGGGCNVGFILASRFPGRGADRMGCVWYSIMSEALGMSRLTRRDLAERDTSAKGEVERDVTQ